MPNRTRQPNNRRPVRPEIEITPTPSGIPAQWQQPSAPQRRTDDRHARGSPSGQRPAEPSQWQQSPDYRRRSSRSGQARYETTGSIPAAPFQRPRRRRKRRPPLSTVLFPGRAQRRRNHRRRHAAPANRAERQKQRLKRQRRYLLFHKLFTLLLILSTGIFALTLFFKVDTVTIDGRSRYTNSQLLETAAINQGDNLFLLPRRAVRKRLMDEYPYLDTVKIQQKPPNSVIIHITEAIPAAAVGSGTTYYFMDAGGKLLEQVSLDRLGTIPVVTGVTVDDVKVGKYLDMRRNERLQQLTKLLSLLEEYDLMQRVDFINLSDMNNVRIGCDEHMYIRFGTLDDLEYKMRFAKKFVDETSPSLFCEIEVSGEILWEGRPSYRVIPVSEEEVAAQSRDLDSAVNAEGLEPDPNNQQSGEIPAAPVLPGTTSTEDGEEGDEDDSNEDGKNNDNTNEKNQPSSGNTGSTDDTDDNESGENTSGSSPTPFRPGVGGVGSSGPVNWRTGLRASSKNDLIR